MGNKLILKGFILFILLCLILVAINTFILVCFNVPPLVFHILCFLSGIAASYISEKYIRQ